ncbi:SprT-like domain-containing protein [Pengzhenrongella frigida]|uniref:M48 family peptidase n=1 Tax=Pengzhenrongella frigida TaxID=1259133 RepID=A0A4Q5MX34_9MICO|nr:SprT-like domain-containing protein [Cellulomonas sp. HLT2-17]RYV50198.1 M48 family peptidase [Cellulomonas sp. HLT2-17]
MDIDEARILATQLMGHHRLTGWRLVFDHARTRAGVCRYDRREIGLSRVLTALHPPDLVRETILHEIAHALTGPGHAHDAVWRATALSIGGDGTRSVSAHAPRPPAPWVGECARGHQVTRHRRPTRPASCLLCGPNFDPAHLVDWRLHGRTVPLSAAYETELARIRATQERDRSTAAQRGEGSATRPRLSGQTPLPVGTVVVLHGAGKYAGLTGRIEKRGRTRYHVRTRVGTVTAPFALVRTLLR